VGTAGTGMMDRMVDRVVVVGSGIAGLAMARALQGRDIPVTVLDRLAGPPDAGLAVNLPGNAVQALGALGLGEGLAGLGAPVRRREYRNARGRLLFAVDEDAFWGAAARSRCVRRADLLDLLGRGLPAGTVRWNCPVTGIREGAVELADGTTEDCGFVVGADGVHSTVRAAALGEDQRVLDGERGALCPHRRGRVCRVADEHHATLVPPLDPYLLDRGVVQRGVAGQHRRYRLGEPGERRAQPVGVRVDRPAPGRRRVPVDLAAVDRDQQERAVRAGPHRPAVDAARVGCHEPPARRREQ